MKLILVNFSSTYHRLIALNVLKLGGNINCIFRLPNYTDPRGSIIDEDNSLVDHYITDPIFNMTKIVNIADLQNPEKLIEIYSTSNYPLSEDILNSFIECESVFMRHSDRFSFFPISGNKLRFIFYSLLSYFLELLTEDRPNRVIFADSPHVAFDTVLFYVAKYLEIETIIIERIHVDNTSVALTDYRYKDKVPEDFLAEMTTEQLSKIITKKGSDFLFEELKISKSLNGIWNKHDEIRKSFKPEAPTIKFIRKVNFIVRRILSKPYHFIKRDKLDSNKKKKIIYNRALAFNGSQVSSNIIVARKIYNKYINILNKYHRNQMDGSLDFSGKFIFFPLHMQPEKTTSAFGGYFEDQYLALKILSQSIPSEVKIYVKEHPAQFTLNRIENYHYRSKFYYDLITSIAQVYLLPEDASYNDLLKKSLYVATVAGSAGWESLLRGKSCIVFGEPWYKGCNSCFSVKSVDDCQKAITSIKSISNEEVKNNVLKFLIYTKKNALPFSPNPRHVADYKISYNKQISAYANYILSTL